MPIVYEIRVGSYLDSSWSEWLDGMEITHLDASQTLLTGSFPDQSALYGLLMKIHNLGLSLITVNRLDNSDS